MLASSRAAAALRGRGAAAPLLAASARSIGAQGVPDEWGQPKTGGTQFLGTPANYSELLRKRPISPDLFGVEGVRRSQRSLQCCSRQAPKAFLAERSSATPGRAAKAVRTLRLESADCTVPLRRAGGTHYKFPPVALSSITNRVTGVVLSGGAAAGQRAAGTCALNPNQLVLLRRPRAAVVLGGGVVNLVGDLPAVVDAVKALCVPLSY